MGTHRDQRVKSGRRKQVIKRLENGAVMSASVYGSDALEFDTNFWISCSLPDSVTVKVQQYDKADAVSVHAEPVHDFTRQFAGVESALEWLSSQGVDWSDLKDAPGA